MLTDLIPMIEKTYRVLPGAGESRHGRALDGRHADVPDRLWQTWTSSPTSADSAAAPAAFGGTFDPKTSNNGVFADAAAFNKKVKVLFLGIGSAEGPSTKNFSDQLTKAGIQNVYFESAGTAHEWLTWRRCLNDFAPRLFK